MTNSVLSAHNAKPVFIRAWHHKPVGILVAMKKKSRGHAVNFKSQSTVWDWSEQRHWQDSLTNNWRWQKKHLMLSAVVCSNRWSREEEQAFEQHSRCPCWALFLAAAQQASPSLRPFPWHCCSIKAISCPLLTDFAGGALGVTQHSRVLNSPGPSRKLEGLWSQMLLSSFAAEQIHYKGNVTMYLPFLSETEWK